MKGDKKGERAQDRSDVVCRRYQRQDVLNYSGDIADDKIVVGGAVDNISVNGFKISGVPSSFSGDKQSYSVVVTGPGKNLKLMAKPCWAKKSTGTVDIGFKVIDATWEWYEFVLDSFDEEQVEKTLI